MNYSEEQFEMWLDDVDYEFYVLLGAGIDDYEVDYLTFYLEGYSPEDVARAIFDE